MRVLAAVNKIWSSYLQTEFQQDAHRILEEFTNSVLSTVAARSKVGPGLSCFCPAIVIGGDNHAPLHLLGLLLDGLFERKWIKGSEIEACRGEYQSFVQEQRQLERFSTRSRPDVGDVVSFCSLQAGFRARQHLFKVYIVINMVGTCDRLSRNKYSSCSFPGVPNNSSHCTRASNFRRKISSLCQSVWWFARMRCVVLCLACRISWGDQISPRETSFLTLASLCWLNLQHSVTASQVLLFLNPGATWRPRLV